MAGVVVDASIWIEFFAGSGGGAVVEVLDHGVAVLPPIVVAELMSGAATPSQREAIGELLQNAPVHDTPLEHCACR